MSHGDSLVAAKPQLQSLQVFRGLAALAVVAHHVVLRTDAFVGKVLELLATILRMGHLGVDFFFVLSGFIIMYAHMGGSESWPSVRCDAFKRLLKIFPAYLPVSLAHMVLYAFLPSLSSALAELAGYAYSLAIERPALRFGQNYF